MAPASLVLILSFQQVTSQDVFYYFVIFSAREW